MARGRMMAKTSPSGKRTPSTRRAPLSSITDVSDESTKHGCAVATGGEGFRFEHIVGAYYLASLLLQSGTYGLSRGTTKRVQLQRGAFDHPLDDLIVVADTAEGEAMLALQIKRNLNFTRADATFLKAMGQAWKEFSKPNFNRGPDRIG